MANRDRAENITLAELIDLSIRVRRAREILDELDLKIRELEERVKL